jgi:hypothetical protein
MLCCGCAEAELPVMYVLLSMPCLPSLLVLPLLLLPQVFACAAAVAAAEAHLQALLPRLASAAGVSSLSYVAIQNQGSYMVELPASRTSVPQGWEKVTLNRHFNPVVLPAMMFHG